MRERKIKIWAIWSKNLGNDRHIIYYYFSFIRFEGARKWKWYFRLMWADEGGRVWKRTNFCSSWCKRWQSMEKLPIFCSSWCRRWQSMDKCPIFCSSWCRRWQKMEKLPIFVLQKVVQKVAEYGKMTIYCFSWCRRWQKMVMSSQAFRLCQLSLKEWSNIESKLPLTS